jgi:polyribonucleotide nucleotidyltransferase
MNATIAVARSEVRDTAPKIVSFQIPLDRIGEVIGPKGKVINTIQQETGADVNIDDDGVVGTVSIGSVDGRKVEDAMHRIQMIIDPPKADVGAIYTGRVVNITKFGAFVNILPGRDGLIHISKLGRGKRINRVEVVVDLGDEIEVRVDEIDEKGKVSLSPVGDAPDVLETAGAPARVASESSGGGSAVRAVSFEDSFEAEARETFGDLGPSGGEDRSDRSSPSSDRGGRDGRRRHR